MQRVACISCKLLSELQVLISLFSGHSTLSPGDVHKALCLD